MIKIIWHANSLPGWEIVFKRQLDKLQSSGLLEECESVHFCVNGKVDIFKDIPKINKKIHLIPVNTSFELWEYPTLNYLHCLSKKENFKTLYIHFKGLTHRNNKNVIDWYNFLEWSTIERWQDSVKILDNYDAVGPNWDLTPWPHFSGNFWWARSEYIRTLVELWHPIETINKFRTRNCFQFTNMNHWRFDFEAWIGSGNPNAFEISRSLTPGGDHYRKPYPPHLYMGKN